MYQERFKRVLDSMEEMGLDQMLVSAPASIWYLTGYDVFPFARLFAFYRNCALPAWESEWEKAV